MTAMESSWAAGVVRHHEKPYGFGMGDGSTVTTTTSATNHHHHHPVDHNHRSPPTPSSSSTSTVSTTMQFRGSLGKLIERSTSAPPLSTSTSTSASESPYLMRYTSGSGGGRCEFEDTTSSCLVGNDLMEQMSRNHADLDFISSSYGEPVHKSRNDEQQEAVRHQTALAMSLLRTTSGPTSTSAANLARSTAPVPGTTSSSSSSSTKATTTAPFLQSGFSVLSNSTESAAITRPLSVTGFGDDDLSNKMEGLLRSNGAPVAVRGGGGGSIDVNGGVGRLIPRCRSAAPTFSSNIVGPPPGLSSNGSTSSSFSNSSPLRPHSALGLTATTTATSTTSSSNRATFRPAPKTPMDLIQEDFPNESAVRSTPVRSNGGMPTTTTSTTPGSDGSGAARDVGEQIITTEALVGYPYDTREQQHQQFRYSQGQQFQPQQQQQQQHLLSPQYQETYNFVQNSLPPPQQGEGGGEDYLQQQSLQPMFSSTGTGPMDHHHPGSIYTTQIHQPSVMQQQQTNSTATTILDPRHQVYYGTSNNSSPHRPVGHPPHGQALYVNTTASTVAASPAPPQPQHTAPYGYATIHYHYHPQSPSMLPPQQQRLVAPSHQTYQQQQQQPQQQQHHVNSTTQILQQQPMVHNGGGVALEQQYISLVPMQAAATGSNGYWQPPLDMSSMSATGTTALHPHLLTHPQHLPSTTVAIVNAPSLPPGTGTMSSPFALSRVGTNSAGQLQHQQQQQQHMERVQQQRPNHSLLYGGGNGGACGANRGGRDSNNKGRGRRGGGGGGNCVAGRRVADAKHGAVNGGGGGSSGATSISSARLEEFRASKNRDWTMHQIVGYVVEFCQDQNGSRFIQQRLEMGDPMEQQVAAKEIIPAIRRLRNDVFGNYVVQKLLDFGSPKTKADIRDTLQGEMLQLSLQMYGCRVVQKALEALDVQDVSNLLVEFHHNVLSCIHDQNGNHVVQKCIEVMSKRAKKARNENGAEGKAQAAFLNEQIDFIIDDVLVNTMTLSCHPYGCRVLQRILEHCDEERKEEVLNKIATCHKKLLDDQYGNYVIQHVLQFGRERDRDAILAIVVENGLLILSRQKFASNVVEKLLKYGNERHRCAIVREMLKEGDAPAMSSIYHTSFETDGGSGNHAYDASKIHNNKSNNCSVVLLMVRDAYANYVVQTTLDVVPESEEKVLLLQELNMHSNELRQYTFAKHIVAKLGAIAAVS